MTQYLSVYRTKGFISAFTSSYSYVELLAIIQFPKCTTISLRSRPLHISLPFPKISLAVKYMHYAVLIWVWKQLPRGLSVEISPFFLILTPFLSPAITPLLCIPVQQNSSNTYLYFLFQSFTTHSSLKTLNQVFISVMLFNSVVNSLSLLYLAVRTICHRRSLSFSLLCLFQLARTPHL